MHVPSQCGSERSNLMESRAAGGSTDGNQLRRNHLYMFEFEYDFDLERLIPRLDQFKLIVIGLRGVEKISQDFVMTCKGEQ